ncbi:MAG: pantoate--beta-alanine ligase [Clostridia bacterium]
MKIITSISEMKQHMTEIKRNGKTVGFIPTMGFLHEGHISLANRAVSENDFTVLSIFVNPTQFGLGEDLDRYPRDFAHDCSLSETAGVDVLFAPTVSDMYPNEYSTFVEVEKISSVLCGASRAGHFKGVATVVNKLFHICLPDRAYFGQKDYQQVQVIRRMVSDLNMDITIVSCPIVREQDGLAMSSRNTYLSTEERKQALILHQSLAFAQELVGTGERNAVKLIGEITTLIQTSPLADIEYVAVADVNTLKAVESIQGKVLLALAVRFGKTRLIDNIVLEV